MTMSSVVAVLSEVKDLNTVAKAMDMPNELSRDIFTDSAEREETVGRVSTFWLQGSPSWRQLRGILQTCDEHKALELNNVMELYNREGMLGEVTCWSVCMLSPLYDLTSVVIYCVSLKCLYYSFCLKINSKMCLLFH